MEEHEVNSIYEGNKITGLSISSLKNAADKGNAIITRRKTGHLMEEHEVNSIYEGNKITGLSISSLKNAADKRNAIITRRKDKQ